MRAYPYNERELLSKKAFRLDQGFTSYIEKNLKVSLKKNLYFPKLTNYNTGALALFPNTTILACPFEKPPVFSSAFLKQYLGAITRTPRKNAVETPELPDDCLLFYDKSAPADTPYRTLTAKSAPHLHQAEKPTLPTKVLVLDPLPSEAPEGAKTWLFKLTGGQLDLLDQLAALLARAASPTCSKNISVLYSAQNADKGNRKGHNRQ